MEGCALRAVGIRPSVLHLNEGHSAAALEATRQSMEVQGQPPTRSRA
ncbi:MAG: hypothetical protein U0166_27805 [Acidobacteriota bacterium]